MKNILRHLETVITIKTIIKKKIKICFPFVGDSIGGSHISAIELIKKLDKNFFSPIIVLHKKGILYNRLISDGLNPNHLKITNFVGKKKGFIPNLLSILKNTLLITSYIKKKKIDIVHLNDSSAGLSWIFPTKISEAKLIWHQRVAFPKWRLYKTLFFFTEKIICISKFVYKTIPNYSKKKATIVFNPISIKKIKTKSIKNNYLKIKSDLENNKIKKILFLANIIESKRVDFFIKIAEEIIKKKIIKNSKFYIVGSDKKNLLKNNIFNNKIIYIGHEPNKEIFLKYCDLLIVTAENEGFNRTIVEGMLSKIPVIAVKSGAHSEIIKNNFNGWLVKKNNINNFVSTITKVLNLEKNKLRDILNKSKNLAKKNYNISNHATKISEIYFKLFSSK